jgi:hypothetical protein
MMKTNESPPSIKYKESLRVQCRLSGKQQQQQHYQQQQHQKELFRIDVSYHMIQVMKQ